jgi:hypothetical protein
MRRRLIMAAVLAIVAVQTSACTIPKWMLKEGATTGTKSNPNLLTTTDLVNSGFTTLYDAVNKLRPTWITGGGRGIPMYLNNDAPATVDDMKNILVENVLEVKFTRGDQAVGKWGDLAKYGLVQIRLK